jgi:hypothetical protein
MPVACAPSMHLTRTASASLRSPFAVPSRTCPRDDPGSCAQQPLRYRFALAPMSCRCRCEGTQFPRGRRRRPGERSDRCDEGAPAHSTITSSRTNRHRPATVPHSRRPLTDTSARERSEREGGRPRPTGGAERDRCDEGAPDNATEHGQVPHRHREGGAADRHPDAICLHRDVAPSTRERAQRTRGRRRRPGERSDR